jgi:hypothetical protein
MTHRIVPCLLAVALGCAPLAAADEAEAHAAAAAAAKDSFAELDRLVDSEMTKMDAAVVETAQVEQKKIEETTKAATVAQIETGKKAKPGAKANELVTAVEQDPEERIDQLIEQASLMRGLNEDKGNAFVAVATVPVLEAPGTPAYGISRVNAYNQAFNIARLEIVKFVATTVSSGTAIDRVKRGQLPQGNEVSKDDQIAAKVAALKEAELDAALRARGVDPASVTPERKRKTLENTVRQVVATEAAGDVFGSSVFAVAEGVRYNKQHMTVAVLWSPNLQRMARFLLSHGTSELPKPTTGRPLKEQLPQSPQELATRFGVKPCVDEKGERWLIGFGQIGVDADPADADVFAASAAMAEKIAEDQALNAIKAFAFEQTSTQAASEIAETLQTLQKANGDVEKIKKTVANLEEEIRSGSANIKIAGATTLKKWNALVDGAPVVGVVKAWSAKSLRQAGELKKEMKDKRKADEDKGGKGADRHRDTPDRNAW